MSITQPSPDELIYEPQHRTALVPLRFLLSSTCFLYVLATIGVFSSGILDISEFFSKGNIFSIVKVLSTFQESPFLNIFLLGFIVFAISNVGLGCATFPRVFQYLWNYRIAEHCILSRLKFDSKNSSGLVSIQSRDLFWRKTQLEIPFDEIFNIQICCMRMLSLNSEGIELIRKNSTQPIALRYISFYSNHKNRRITSSVLPSAIEEVEAISDFLQLPQKPSYSAPKGCGSVATGSLKKQNILNVSRGSQTLEFSMPYRVPGGREKWRFDGASSQTSIEYGFMSLKVAKEIPRHTVRDVLVVREFVGINDYLLKMTVDRQPRDKYSIILIAQGITKKGIRERRHHFLTSTDLLRVREIAQELRQYLNLPSDDANNAQLTHSSSLGHS
jgi:hypothetical protein